MPLSDIEIARRTLLRRITDLARERLGIADEHLVPYGHFKAKLSLDHIATLQGRPEGKLVLREPMSSYISGVRRSTEPARPATWARRSATSCAHHPQATVPARSLPSEERWCCRALPGRAK